MREKFTYRILTSISLHAINLFVNYLLVLRLDKDLLGIIAFSTSLIILLSLFRDLGMGYIYIQKNAEKNYKELFSIFFLLKTLLIIGNFIPVFIVIFLLNFEPLVFNFLILKAISELITLFSTPWLVNLEGRIKLMKKSTISFIVSISKDMLILLVVINLETIQNPLVLMGFIYISVSILQLLLLLFFSRGEYHFNKINRDVMIEFLKATKPLILFSIVNLILTNLGRVLLDTSFSHEALADYYFVETIVISSLFLISGQIHDTLSTYFPK